MPSLDMIGIKQYRNVQLKAKNNKNTVIFSSNSMKII